MNKIETIFTDPNETYFIGEISCNHNNNLQIVLDTAKALKDIGADAMKIQTDFLDGTGSTMNFQNKYFQVSGTIWEGRNLFELYEEAHTPIEWHKIIFDYCKEIGLDCFSTPYSHESIRFLQNFDFPAIKVASMEASDVQFVAACAALHKPIIISTGMLQPHEISRTVEACRKAGNNKIILLNCVSEYPAPIEKTNAKLVDYFKKSFDVVTGLSDHTLDNIAGQLTISYGGQVFEKHIKLDESITGPDESFSLTIDEFSQFMDCLKKTKTAVGDGVPKNRDIDVNYSRSIFVVKDVKAGEKFTEDNIRIIRPGHGLHPNEFNNMLGRNSLIDISAGTPLVREMVDVDTKSESTII